MANLPHSSKIPLLTEKTLHDVAVAHLKQLLAGTTKDPNQAAKFIEKALGTLASDVQLYQANGRQHLADRGEILKFVPHVEGRLKGEASVCQTCRDAKPKPRSGRHHFNLWRKCECKKLDQIVEDWFARNEIRYYRCVSNRNLWIFETWDDAILFKLRWT